MESKLLDLNHKKSNYILVGSKQSRKKFRKELDKEPLTLCGEPMKEAKNMKFLGDIIGFSNEESVHLTVVKRSGIARQAAYEIRTVIEDRRANHIGSTNLAFEIFNAAVVNMLFYNCETWEHIQKRTIRLLNSIYQHFFAIIFRIGKGSPSYNFFWQTGMLKPELVILQRQLVFIHHVANLSESSLAFLFYQRQIENPDIPSLVSTIKPHLTKLDFETNKYSSKWRWKKIVKSYIHDLGRDMLLEEISKSKKISYTECMTEKYERKPYFYTLNLEQAKDRLRISSAMVPTIKGNFSSKFRGESMKCESCKKSSPTNHEMDLTTEENYDSMNHCKYVCPAFDDLRNLYSLETDIGIVEFFRSVVKRRAEEEEI